jgi:inner membrane protein
LTTYAIALFAPLGDRWYSGDAIFIVDWVYWLLMGVGIAFSAHRWKRNRANPGRPAQVAGVLMLAYIGFNLGESQAIERAVAAQVRAQGIEPTLVVASPPPIFFWDRSVAWQSADRWGRADYHLSGGLTAVPGIHPRNLDNPKLAAAATERPHVAGFLRWSRMPAVVEVDGKTYLTDLRYYDPAVTSRFGPRMKAFAKRHSFLVPLD